MATRVRQCNNRPVRHALCLCAYLKRAPVGICSIVGQVAALQPNNGAFVHKHRASERRAVVVQATLDECKARCTHGDRPRGKAAQHRSREADLSAIDREGSLAL
eukprot:7377975-Prymnesium_polylepis.1